MEKSTKLTLLKQVAESVSVIEESIKNDPIKKSSFYGIDSEHKHVADFIKSCRTENPELYNQIINLD